MARIVKARLKENIPECCPEYAKRLKEEGKKGIIELNLDDDTYDPVSCAYCKRFLGVLHGVAQVKDNCYVPIDLFDIIEEEVVN